jgi:signal transduction histidine kinase
VAALGSTLEQALQPGDVLPAVADAAAAALAAPYVAVDEREASGGWLRRHERGTPAAPELELPLPYAGETIGRLVVGGRAALSAGERGLVAEIARQGGVALHTAALTSELQRAREQLVHAREEERRRLRRDLHDGLGPTLAGLGLKLDAARNLLGQDPRADAVLADLAERTQAAVGDIRRLVYALRPPALDEFGLVAAIREHAAQYETADGVRVVVTAPDALPSLPAAVEVAAFRIAMEALTNVVRHAHAHTCHVHLELADALHLEITDDGIGLPDPVRIGVGLTSMRERAAELGGECRIQSNPEGGTRVAARLPVPKA